jgi:hypothetical protein
MAMLSGVCHMPPGFWKDITTGIVYHSTGYHMSIPGVDQENLIKMKERLVDKIVEQAKK